MSDGLEVLNSRERLDLLKFVCSFAWADLEVRPQERIFTKRLVERLELAPAEALQVGRWLDLPPAPDSVDPAQIPARHKDLFLRVLDGVIRADGEVATEEREHFELLREMLG